MSEVIYVLSGLSLSEETYKVGSHTGTIQRLKSRYITAIPKLKIHCFIYTNNAVSIENEFKWLNHNFRVINSNGSVSEWYQLPLTTIVSTLLLLINKPPMCLDDQTVVIDARIKREIVLITSTTQNNSSTPVLPLSDEAQYITRVESSTSTRLSLAQKELNDDLRLKELKAKGVKYRSTFANCLTEEEVERYRITERIKRRKDRAKAKLKRQTTSSLQFGTAPLN